MPSPGYRDLVPFHSIRGGLSDLTALNNTCEIPPDSVVQVTSVIVAISILFYLSSIWAIINVLKAPLHSDQTQALVQRLAQTRLLVQGMMHFTSTIIYSMVLLSDIPFLTPDLAFRFRYFVRFVGALITGSWTLYLNPHSLTDPNWLIYLLGSSIGSTALLMHLAHPAPVDWIELFILMSYGGFALLMQPLMRLKLYLCWHYQSASVPSQDFLIQEYITQEVIAQELISQELVEVFRAAIPSLEQKDIPTKPPIERNGPSRGAGETRGKKGPKLRGGNSTARAEKRKKYIKIARWFAT